MSGQANEGNAALILKISKEDRGRCCPTGVGGVRSPAEPKNKRNLRRRGKSAVPKIGE